MCGAGRSAKKVNYGQNLENPIEIEENGLSNSWMSWLIKPVFIWINAITIINQALAKGRKVLDCFAYRGFTINSLFGQAGSVCLVDSSKVTLDGAQKNIRINKLNLDNVTFIDQDVFKYLRVLRDQGEHFDLIILDPPKFAPTVSQAERAARGYKDINLLAFKLLNPGGYLMTFSCSGGVSEDLFQKIVAGAALEAGADAKILKRLHQAIDHPVAMSFPEGAYLKGFLVKKQN
jgi:23S rRNA (cytosine1962-C5)-methyltransferase